MGFFDWSKNIFSGLINRLDNMFKIAPNNELPPKPLGEYGYGKKKVKHRSPESKLNSYIKRKNVHPKKIWEYVDEIEEETHERRAVISRQVWDRVRDEPGVKIYPS